LAKPQPKSGTKGKPAPKDDDEDAVKPPSSEIAAKSDYQLSQAMNLLKAWQIIQAR
jgi:carboxyl-terminal processing protease